MLSIYVTYRYIHIRTQPTCLLFTMVVVQAVVVVVVVVVVGRCVQWWCRNLASAYTRLFVSFSYITVSRTTAFAQPGPVVVVKEVVVV